MSTPPHQAEPYSLSTVMPTPPPRKRRTGLVVGVVIAVLAAAGLGAGAVLLLAGEEEPAAAPPATAATSANAAPVQEVKVGKLYFSLDDLRADVESKTPMRCTTYNEIPNPTGAIARAECTEDSGFGIYNDKTEAEASARSVGEMIAGGLGEASIHVVGQNWTVNCSSDRTLCEQVQAGLGGELLVIEAG